jgi:hypothetical protein
MRLFVERFVRKDQRLYQLYSSAAEERRGFTAEWIAQAFHLLSSASESNTVSQMLGDIFWQTFAYDQASPDPSSVLVVMMLLDQIAPETTITLEELLDPARQRDALFRASEIFREFQVVLPSAARAALSDHFKVRYRIVDHGVYVEESSGHGLSSLAPLLAGTLFTAGAAMVQYLRGPAGASSTFTAAIDWATAALLVGATVSPFFRTLQKSFDRVPMPKALMEPVRTLRQAA